MKKHDLERDRKDAQREISRLDEEIEDLKRMYSDEEKEIEELRSQVAELHEVKGVSEIEELRAENERLRYDLEGKMQTLVAENERLKEDIFNLRDCL